ncbi:MAG: hypothetical protein C0404_11790 [Verrucomicrobia bacterium]|nr:hypothetical protein [Verrucomicrobiota bacterium]
MKTIEATEFRDRLSGNSYSFGKDGEYRVVVAKTLEDRKRAWAMVYRMYLDKGYAKPDPAGLWYGIHDALPQTTTFLVTRRGEDVATLTIVFDSDIGLPADGLYRDELDGLRNKGHRLCEIISLVSDETDRRQAIEVLKHMFKVAYLMACKLADATDFIITVNPHHAAYYERKLLFRRQGDVRTYGKVSGAPAVLLVLDLEEAPDRYIAKYGMEPGSLMHHFCDVKTGSEAIWFLAENTSSNGRAELIGWFAARKPEALVALRRIDLPFDASREMQEYSAIAGGGVGSCDHKMVAGNLAASLP